MKKPHYTILLVNGLEKDALCGVQAHVKLASLFKGSSEPTEEDKDSNGGVNASGKFSFQFGANG